MVFCFYFKGEREKLAAEQFSEKLLSRKFCGGISNYIQNLKILSFHFLFVYVFVSVYRKIINKI